MKKILLVVIVLLLAVISFVTITLQEKRMLAIEFNKTLTNGSIVSLGEGERNGSLLVQKIYSDHVEGLNFREYPVATINGTPINLSVGQTASNGCNITLTLVRIENKTAKFSITANESIVCLGEGDRNGPLLVQKIYPDHIEGLNFREYPVATINGIPINLSIGQAASNGCTITLTLISIENKTAKFLRKEERNKPCPICLSGNTYIDTPDGKFYVWDLKEGMAVWTLDSSGSKQAAVILGTSKMEVPEDFQLVYIALNDGRELLASPGHPLADGRIIGNIREGDTVDNGTVVSAKRVPYEGEFTYDILPSGDTGIYWANGIPVRSTLAASK